MHKALYELNERTRAANHHIHLKKKVVPRDKSQVPIRKQIVVKHGNTSIALGVYVKYPVAEEMSNMVCKLDPACLGGDIQIIAENKDTSSAAEYIKLIRTNEFFHDETQVIVVDHFRQEYFDVEYQEEENEMEKTVGKLLKHMPGLVSIEPTDLTEEKGRYFFLCRNSMLEDTKANLHKLISHLQNTLGLYPSHHPQIEHFDGYPCITGKHRHHSSGKSSNESIMSVCSKYESLNQEDPAPGSNQQINFMWTLDPNELFPCNMPPPASVEPKPTQLQLTKPKKRWNSNIAEGNKIKMDGANASLKKPAANTPPTNAVNKKHDTDLIPTIDEHNASTHEEQALHQPTDSSVRSEVFLGELTSATSSSELSSAMSAITQQTERLITEMDTMKVDMNKKAELYDKNIEAQMTEMKEKDVAYGKRIDSQIESN